MHAIDYLKVQTSYSRFTTFFFLCYLFNCGDHALHQRCKRHFELCVVIGCSDGKTNFSCLDTEFGEGTSSATCCEGVTVVISPSVCPTACSVLVQMLKRRSETRDTQFTPAVAEVDLGDDKPGYVTPFKYSETLWNAKAVHSLGKCSVSKAETFTCVDAASKTFLGQQAPQDCSRTNKERSMIENSLITWKRL